MNKTAEDLQRALDHERQELANLLDPRRSNLGLDPLAPSVESKREMLRIARELYGLSADPAANVSSKLKVLETAYRVRLAELPESDTDQSALAALGSAVKRVFVATFAVQYLA